MNENPEVITRFIATALGVLVLVVLATLIYAIYLVGSVTRLVRSLPRRAQVERDHTGRRLKERL